MVETFDDMEDIYSQSGVLVSGGDCSLDYHIKADDFEGQNINSGFWNEYGPDSKTLTTGKSHSGDKSLNIQPDVTDTLSNGVEHLWSSNQHGPISVWMYDYNTNSQQTFKLEGSGGMCHFKIDSGSKYLIRRPGGSSDIETSIARSDGWHKFEFRVSASGTTPYIDGVQALNPMSAMTSFTTVKLQIGWNQANEGWYDDFEYNKTAAMGWVNGTPIVLPEDMTWDSVQVSSFCPTGASLDLTIVDGGTRAPIPSFTDISMNRMKSIDISQIENPSIALEFDMSGNGYVPFVYYWGISFNGSGSWRDSLFGGAKIGPLPESFEQVDGDLLKTSDFGKNEIFRTTSIKIPQNYRPETLAIIKTDEPSGRIFVSVLSGSDLQPFDNCTDRTEKSIDLTHLVPGTFNSIVLESRFDATSSSIPVLHDWAISWILYKAPEIGEIPPIDVDEGALVEAALDLAQYTTDNDHDSRDLTYELGDISDNCEINLSIVEGHYLRVDATVAPDWNSEESGVITAKVTAREDAGVISEPGEISVWVESVNDVPVPSIVIPDIVMNEGSKNQDVLLNSEDYFIDGDFDRIYYSVEVNPEDNWSGDNLSLKAKVDPLINSLEIESVGDFFTEYDNPVPIRVLAGDNAEVMSAYQDVLVTVLNVNDAPRWGPIPDIVVDEDSPAKNLLSLADFVTDVDNEPDDITFWLLSNDKEDIHVTVSEEGWLSVIPEPNVWGDAWVEVEVTDGMDSEALDILVEVLPVNDIPTVDFLKPVDSDVVKGVFTAEGTANDTDNGIQYVQLKIQPAFNIPSALAGSDSVKTSIVKAEGTEYWSFEWDTRVLTNGYWRLTANAFDGEDFSENVTVVITLDNPSNRAPLVSLTSHANGAQISSSSVLEGTSVDIDGTVRLVQISFYDNTSWRDCHPEDTSLTFETWSYPLDGVNLQGKNVTVYLRAYDGELFSPEIMVTLEIDTSTGNGNRDDRSSDAESDGGLGGFSTILAVVALVIGVLMIIIVFIIVNRRNKRHWEEEEDRKRDGESLEADIVSSGYLTRPGDAGRPAPGPGAPPMTDYLGMPIATQVPSRHMVAPVADDYPVTPAGVPPIPPERQLPVNVGVAPSPIPTDQPVVMGGQSPQNVVKTTKPIEMDHMKPVATAVTVSPGAPDKAEVYHQDSGAVWTPDMGESRAAREAEGAVEMLAKLTQLKEVGGISEEEFERSKKRLLRKI